MLSDLGVWMATGIVEAQQTHFGVSKTTIKLYMSGWDSRLKDLKQELACVIRDPFC